MFLAGVSLWYFAAAVATVVGLVTAVLKSHGTSWQLLHDYQFRRIFTFLDPDADPLGAGYHITQAKIAMGSGGLTGRGFMQGTQSRLNFLPEKHTDFIFTTLAEEFGFVGTIALLVLYALIVVFCIVSAISNRDRFGALLTGGIATIFFLLVRGQHGHGDGADAGRRRAAAAGLLRRLGDAGAAGRLRPRAERARPPAARPGLSVAARPVLRAGADWPLWRPHLRARLRRARASTVEIVDRRPAGPGRFDYVVYHPGGRPSRLRAVHRPQGGAQPLGRGRADRRQSRRSASRSAAWSTTACAAAWSSG